MSTGDEILLWPSGRPSALVTQCREGQVISITADDDKGTVLANFDYQGVGGVSYANGKPWLVVSLEGWSVSDKMGNIIERGAFPRKFPPLTMTVNLALTVTFKDRWDIQVKYVSEDVRREWECGEKLRRTEPYTNKAIGKLNGRMQLDVASIRQRQADVGSLYVPVGPHAYKTERSGLGNLKAKLSRLPSESSLMDTIRGLQESDQRISMINNNPPALYGTSRMGSTGALFGSVAGLNMSQSLGASGTQSAPSTLRANYMSTILPDYGSPPLSETQKRLKRRPKPEVYKSRRRKLSLLGGSEAEIEAKIFGKDLSKDQLIVVCILATWNPVCTKLEPQLEYANCELHQEAASDPSSSASHILILKLDASDGCVLQNKYDFKLSPMFLFFYDTKLVSVSNDTFSSSQLKSEAASALEKGRKGNFLPEGFKFRGTGMCSIGDL